MRLVLHTLVLGAARSADAVSLDSLAGRARPEPHYGWPLQLMNAASTLTYLLAGIAKVVGPSGWGRRLGRIWAVNTFGMHWGIKVIMGIRFRYQLSGISFLPWFDIEKIPNKPWHLPA